MRKLRLIWFWCVAFIVIIWNILKGNKWHMIYIDFHFGNKEDGSTIRKQLIAKQGVNSCDIYWQDLNKLFKREEKDV